MKHDEAVFVVGIDQYGNEIEEKVDLGGNADAMKRAFELRGLFRRSGKRARKARRGFVKRGIL